jgi:hypothetical protein
MVIISELHSEFSGIEGNILDILRDNAWIYVVAVLEHLMVLRIGKKPTDIETTGSVVFTYLSVSTAVGTLL